MPVRKAEILSVQKDLEAMRGFFVRVVRIIPKFNILSKKILPYGLKPHTRSVSWLIEQVIVQQAKFNRQKLGARDVIFDLPDTALHDCIVDYRHKKYFVNIKVTNTAGKRNKNDIAAVEKLYTQYKSNPAYSVIYVVFGFTFNNTEIRLAPKSIRAFSPQFLPIYVNPRNDKIQAYYDATPEERTRDEFLKLLVENSRSIILE